MVCTLNTFNSKLLRSLQAFVHNLRSSGLNHKERGREAVSKRCIPLCHELNECPPPHSHKQYLSRSFQAFQGPSIDKICRKWSQLSYILWQCSEVLSAGWNEIKRIKIVKNKMIYQRRSIYYTCIYIDLQIYTYIYNT